MASPIEAHLILADSAQDGGGKVHMLGAGWSITGVPTAPSAVVALLKVPWDRANQPQRLNLQLRTEDGVPVRLQVDPAGEPQVVEMNAQLEVGRPPGLKHGTPIDASFVLPVPPMPLAPGRYEWVLTVGGDSWTASFSVIGTG